MAARASSPVGGRRRSCDGGGVGRMFDRQLPLACGAAATQRTARANRHVAGGGDGSGRRGSTVGNAALDDRRFRVRLRRSWRLPVCARAVRRRRGGAARGGASDLWLVGAAEPKTGRTGNASGGG